MTPAEERELQRLRDRADRLRVDDFIESTVKDLKESGYPGQMGNKEIQDARISILSGISDDVRRGLLDVDQGNVSIGESAGLVGRRTLNGWSSLLRKGLGLLSTGLVDGIDDLDARLHQSTGGKFGTPHTIDPEIQTRLVEKRLERFDFGDAVGRNHAEGQKKYQRIQDILSGLRK